MSGYTIDIRRDDAVLCRVAVEMPDMPASGVETQGLLQAVRAIMNSAANIAANANDYQLRPIAVAQPRQPKETPA